jgi:hypothetical protein
MRQTNVRPFFDKVTTGPMDMQEPMPCTGGSTAILAKVAIVGCFVFSTQNQCYCYRRSLLLSSLLHVYNPSNEGALTMSFWHDVKVTHIFSIELITKTRGIQLIEIVLILGPRRNSKLDARSCKDLNCLQSLRDCCLLEPLQCLKHLLPR